MVTNLNLNNPCHLKARFFYALSFFFSLKMIELILESWQVSRPTKQTITYKVYRMSWSINCVLTNCYIRLHILITDGMNYSRTFKFSPRISVSGTSPLYCDRKVILVLRPGRFERTGLLVLSVNGRHYRITISTIARTISNGKRYCLYDDFVVAAVSRPASYTQERLVTPRRPRPQLHQRNLKTQLYVYV